MAVLTGFEIRRLIQVSYTYIPLPAHIIFYINIVFYCSVFQSCFLNTLSSTCTTTSEEMLKDWECSAGTAKMPKPGLLPEETGAQSLRKSCLLTVLSMERYLIQCSLLELPSLYPIHCKALLITLLQTFRSSYLSRIMKIRIMLELLLTSLQPAVCPKGTSVDTFNFLTANWVLHTRTSPCHRPLTSCHRQCWQPALLSYPAPECDATGATK